MHRQFFVMSYCVYSILAYVPPGPEMQPTRGEIWPKPIWQDDTGQFNQVDPKAFRIEIINKNCELLLKATDRYTKIIKEYIQSPFRVDDTPVNKTIAQLEVNLTKPCESYPYYGMDESYYVYGSGKVVANSIWGILRGLETLSQILVPMSNGMLRIPQTEIYDEPRFAYRGIMLDTARHFISVPKITQLIDAMAYNKFNVFHWHMTDDSSFSYNSTTFPELANKGAYDYRKIYSVEDVALVIDFATQRGIRVIPEFDVPAHTASWGLSHPEIMTQCYGDNKGELGPLNPTTDETFDFLHNFYGEIKSTFPDLYIHLGGDEVDSDCWESNPDIQMYLEKNGLDLGDLPYMFFERLAVNITACGRTPILWQEAVDQNPGIELPAGTMVQVWYNFQTAMPSLTSNGYTTIVSDGFYLHTGDDEADWMHFYKVEPTHFRGSKKQKRLVAGGEACLWTEWINDNNVISVAFPRASAVAERLWSIKPQTDIIEAEPRLEEHNCRMLQRGIETKPANGYGLC